MNKKISVLIFSLSLVVLSAFTTASAQDLKASWLEYQNARNLLNESSVAIDGAWGQLNSGWDNTYANFEQWANSWAIASSAWTEVDSARAIVASTLKITLTDSSPRGTRGINPRVNRPDRASFVPWTPEPTWGSWEELGQAWASLDQGWAGANAAWAELDGAWVTLAAASDAVAGRWTKLDAEWAKINTAWAEIDAAWAGKK